MWQNSCGARVATEQMKSEKRTPPPKKKNICRPLFCGLNHRLGRKILLGMCISDTDPTSKQCPTATCFVVNRYALRTSAQWLAPVLETLRESTRRVETELNCTGDNPVIDHRRDDILHCGNFQVCPQIFPNAQVVMVFCACAPL